ncbi:hypothetical protein Mrose_02718 [Calidithermus roseus]|uniref:Uncharacterized protein n=1 Tax=Calidithermus roseus TaxID=1644118 RepID=A0A399EHZ4_9DEIN|nr:hypothetical protein Mrose_02718 [Calidithermus roseus]
MSIHDLVTSVHSLSPPSEQIPPPTSSDSSREGIPPDLEPILRQPVPDWIRPSEGAEFPADGKLVVEGEIPLIQGGPPAPIDELAYYLPFHFYATGWGIYLRASGILQVASMLVSASRGGLSFSEDVTNLAAAILLQHERFHFFTEVACARAELLLYSTLYQNYFHDQGATAIEEALANAHAFRTSLRGQAGAVCNQVKQWMLSQGPGYRDFTRCLSPATFTKWRRMAIQRMQLHDSSLVLSRSAMRMRGTSVSASPTKLRLQPRGLPAQPMPTEFLFEGVARARAPVFLVQDIATIGVLRPFPKFAGLRVLVHTRDHPPPHIHVEIPPGRDLTRLEWPSLQPLPGDPVLSGSQRESLNRYLSRYREEIDQKIRQVYHPPK